MRIRITLASLLVLFCLAITALPAVASSSNADDPVLYNNGGPITFDGFLINHANVTSDTIFCASACTPMSLRFWIVTPTSNVGSLGQVRWSITSGEFAGVGYNSGVSAIPGTLPCATQGSLSECQVTVPLNGTLADPAGTAWLNLTGVNGPALWAISGGPSQASTCTLVGGVCGPTLFNIPSEAFILGGTSVPEPSSLLLLGSGVLGLATVIRRRMMDR